MPPISTSASGFGNLFFGLSGQSVSGRMGRALAKPINCRSLTVMGFAKSSTHPTRILAFLAAARKTNKERGSNLRWSPSTVGALPGMCPNRSCGRDPGGTASRENSHVVSALGVLGDVEALAFGLDVDAQADDDIDDLVEDGGTDARPHQRGADAPDLRGHL